MARAYGYRRSVCRGYIVSLDTGCPLSLRDGDRRNRPPRELIFCEALVRGRPAGPAKPAPDNHKAPAPRLADTSGGAVGRKSRYGGGHWHERGMSENLGDGRKLVERTYGRPSLSTQGRLDPVRRCEARRTP